MSARPGTEDAVISSSPQGNLHSRRRIDSWSPIFRSKSLGRSESLRGSAGGEEFTISNHVAAGCESTLSSCRLQEFHYSPVIMPADHRRLRVSKVCLRLLRWIFNDDILTTHIIYGQNGKECFVWFVYLKT
jgi:hypothetical protein